MRMPDAWRSAGLIRLPVFDHVPDQRGDPSHHGHPRDLRAAALAHLAVPVLDLLVDAQHVQDHLAQQEPHLAAALFGDRADPLRLVSRVAAAGCKAPEVRQALRPREAMDVAMREPIARLL